MSLPHPVMSSTSIKWQPSRSLSPLAMSIRWRCKAWRKSCQSSCRKNARFSVANVLTASSLVRETGIPAIVDPFSARMTLDQGGVVIRPLQQNLRYHIAIITRGVDTMTQETRQLAEALITGFQADPIIIAAAN